MRFHYAVDKVRLPNVDDIFTISEAGWLCKEHPLCAG
jgi:hypothetical protein